MSNHSLRLVPLGGLGEIGKNMMSLEYGDDILIIDTGLMFPENDMLGIDYVIPDFRYLLERKDHVRGIVVTHGHEDHTGAIRHVLEEIHAPIFATRLTRGLLEVKLARGGMQHKADLRAVEAGGRAQTGPFDIEFFHVCHSIPDGVGLGINTPEGLIVHTGDFKFDHTPVDGWPTDFAKLAELGGRGVLALLAEFHQRRQAWLDALRGRHRPGAGQRLSSGPGPHSGWHLRFADLPHGAGRPRRRQERPPVELCRHQHAGKHAHQPQTRLPRRPR